MNTRFSLNPRRLKPVGIVAFLMLCLSGYSQEKYWVYFTHKTNSGFNPTEFLDAHAIQRRISMHGNLNDTTDWPVDKAFVQQIRQMGIQTGFESRWLNAVVVNTTGPSLEKIRTLPFVKNIEPMGYRKISPSAYEIPGMTADTLLLEKQLEILHGEEFQKHGIDGKGIRIAIFDGGFPGVDTNPVFEHLIKNRQIIKTHDFVDNTENVYGYMTHGTAVFSCIAGIYKGKNMGLATGAEFLLARTEIKKEVLAEEEYWQAAMEWADQNGADIISSSLGYTDSRYSVKNMNGHSTIVSRAATMAAKKGILVINAMGNEGRDPWEVMGAPADADSVLSVAGVDPKTGYHISFSSFGPTSEMHLKPNVCAPGVALTASPSSVKINYGTSFSTPIIAGFAACVWQLNRQKTNMEIFNLIEKSGHLFPYFDYAHGYGIPQANWFFNDSAQKKEEENPIILNQSGDYIDVEVTDLSKTDENYKNYLYYHIQNKEGVLSYYALLEVSENRVVSIPVNRLAEGSKLRVYYKGFIKELKL